VDVVVGVQLVLKVEDGVIVTVRVTLGVQLEVEFVCSLKAGMLVATGMALEVTMTTGGLMRVEEGVWAASGTLDEGSSLSSLDGTSGLVSLAGVSLEGISLGEGAEDGACGVGALLDAGTWGAGASL
jgi:hypothetical protein